MEKEYVGTRWYKCDFHLHTMQSKCYKNRTDTVEEWVNEVKNKGLDCIAITDHNDYRKIAEVKEKCEKQGIVAFPGVEITCNSGKTHLLVIFDTSKDEDRVRDFLTIAGIDSENVGNSVGSGKSVLEVCKLAKEKEGIVIASHIDEFNSISCLGDSHLKKLLASEYLDAVQVVNEEIWNQYSNKSDLDNITEKIREKYNKNDISKNDVDIWRKTYNKAIEAGIPLLNFSDNPYEKAKSEHGLWGIGKEYTWIKMDENPNLESLRQALLSEDMRIRRSYKCKKNPSFEPDVWIKSMRVESTLINPNNVLNINFNPQLNTVIGGRGSGKSSIIRLLMGALTIGNKTDISSIVKEQEQFYQRKDKKGFGILTKNTKIDIMLYRNDEEYCVQISNISSKESQNIKIFKITDNREEEVDGDVINFLKIQVYTQKQIFEIAKEPEALLKIIDEGIETLNQDKNELKDLYNKKIVVLSEIRNLEQKISDESAIMFELEDLENQINKYKQSGINDIINKKQELTNDKECINKYLNDLSENIEKVENAADSVKKNIEIGKIKTETIRLILEDADKKIKMLIDELNEKIKGIKEIERSIKRELESGVVYKEIVDNQEKFENVCDELENQQMDITKLDSLLELCDTKKKNLSNIEKCKIELGNKKSEYDELSSEYREKSLKIRDKRRKYIDSILSDDDNVKIEIIPEKNGEKFVNEIIGLLQKENNTFVIKDVERIMEEVVEKKKIDYFRDLIKDIRNGNASNEFSNYFKTSIESADASIIDKMLAYELEDKIEVKYRPEGGRTFLPLSSASAGQKTAAILTFVLAYGTRPLLLDQPEDDLDNRLVYSLVVKRLKKAKEKRQIIVVTHNANIPVNGDAEYIISMKSDSRYVQIKSEGTLEKKEIREEICDVMEGTEYAFEMRAKKYHLKVKK